MNARLLLIALERETDIVPARKRTRRLAELLGFDAQDQTRITTAVSELARNALEYAGGGRIEFRLSDGPAPRTFEIVVKDGGPGIADLDAILAGARRSTGGMGIGLLGARRLMDAFSIDTAPGTGTTVRIGKRLPARAAPLTQADQKRIVQLLAADAPADAVDEIRRQNQEMLIQLGELQDRQEELTLLNQELQDTNRGVVALYAELDERADHLRRADELKSKFLSNMSHEFRTPLNSILALSRLLLTRSDGVLTPEQEKQVQFIRKAAESLSELVNDLLDLAKVEAGKTVVTPVEFTAESLFGTLRGMLRPLLVGDAVALVFEDPSDVPPLVTDEGKVSQILRNFISNAIKFTESGEVRVWAAADPHEDTVTFSVRDTGIGIAEQYLDVIFQEFGQIAHPMQSRVKGTGLGLPLSRKLAGLLGGRITVESAPGQGSVFSVTVPRVYRVAEAATDLEEKWQVEAGRLPVLAVEDDPADAFTLERLLAPSRYQPLPARTIAEARRVLDRVKPVAVLLDVLLLGDECWRLLIELKHRDTTCDIPIIVISSTGDERKAFHLGADAYLQKPVDPGQVIDVLDRLSERRSVTKVLLVDDEEVTRYLVRQLLPRAAYDVREAATGAESLAQLHDERPDVVLLDLNMSGMNGYEFLDRLGAPENADDVPAVVLTSAVLGVDERRRLARAARIVPKSDLSTSSLIDAIRDALRPMPERSTP